MTIYDPQRHHRRSIRLRGHDYRQPGAYFIPIVTQGRLRLFGEVASDRVPLNSFREIVRAEWRPYARLDEWELVVMPNHVHGIIRIVDDNVVARRGNLVRGGTMRDHVGARRRCATTTPTTMSNVIPGSIGAILRAFKPATPNASTNCATRPARPSGNAITTNISSTGMPYAASANTSERIPCAGRWIANIPDASAQMNSTCGCMNIVGATRRIGEHQHG